MAAQRAGLVGWGALIMAAASSLLLPGFARAALPPTYEVQRLNSPNPTIGGNYGIGMVSPGDVDGDGEADLLIGTDEHGGSVGEVFLISGEDGSTIRTTDAPAADAAGSGTLASFGSYGGGISDIGSCPGGSNGATCPAAIGAPDGVPDLLVTANGVDVDFVDPDTMANATLVDAGLAYVIDGDTGAILKRIQMPDVDLDEQQEAPGGPQRPRFGRTILSPSSPYGAGNAAAAAGVQIGDLNGGGAPDFIVGASDYFETGATANPASECASNPANECLQAGRAYVYFGETIAGSDPAARENTPDITIKNPAAQPDDPDGSVNANRESMGYSVSPVGDVGACTTDPNMNPSLGGDICVNADSTGTPDGRPDIVLSSHRTDDFGMFDVGVALLLDGSNGSVLYTYRHPEPQPASLFAFSNYNQPAIGDVGSSTAPDVYQAAMRQNNPYTGGGKGYFMNGQFKQPGSPNSISFATATDPTPNPSEDFGTSSAGIGNVSGDSRNEVLIGAYGPHNPGTNQDVINDVHIYDPIHELALQSIPAPDRQAGSGFGTSLAPLGDLNEDGFLDFAVGAGLYDLTTAGPPCPASCSNAGRVYLFRSSSGAGSAGGGGSGGGAVATIAAPAGRTVSLSAKRKTRAGKSVELTGELVAPADPGACEAHQTIELLKRPVKKGKRRNARRAAELKSFATASTEGSGTFRKRVRVKKTFLYRARVGESAGCTAATSGKWKVKALKRKKKRKG